MKKNAVPAEPALSLQAKRNDAIRSEYFRMFNVQGKRNEVILRSLSDKYFLAPDTIERIVFRRGRYRPETVQISENQALIAA